jgi:DNA replication protein DnaC
MEQIKPDEVKARFSGTELKWISIAESQFKSHYVNVELTWCWSENSLKGSRIFSCCGWPPRRSMCGSASVRPGYSIKDEALEQSRHLLDYPLRQVLTGADIPILEGLSGAIDGIVTCCLLTEVTASYVSCIIRQRRSPKASWRLISRRLNLAHTRRIYKDVADRAEKEGWSYRDFLALLLAEEVARRKQARLQCCTRSAHFLFFKTIDEFDFALQSTLRESVIGSCLGLDFVTKGRSLILHGKTGRGKTHLAVAIGYRAIQNGFETLFTTAAELIEDLSNASKRGNLQESLTTYTHPHVQVIDEVGYLTYGPDAANVLFHFVNDRHLRKRPVIFTTNKPMNDWGRSYTTKIWP